MAESKNDIVSELQFIKGVGPVRAKAFASEGLLTNNDLVLYFPRTYIDRNSAQTISQIRSELINAESNETEKILDFSLKREYTLICRVLAVQLHQFSRRKMLSLTVADGSGLRGKILFWNKAEYFNKIYSKDMLIVVSGKPELDKIQTLTFNHPEIEIIEKEEAEEYSKGVILPKYKLSEKMKEARISLPIMRKILKNLLEAGSFHIEETIDQKYIDALKLPSIHDTIKALHFPTSKPQLELARYRVKFEEFLHYQLMLAMKRKHAKNSEKGIVISEKSSSARKLYESLPFELTNSQKVVLNDIDSDFRSGKNMNRLLQGDVGSGKTIVAILSMLMAIDAGYQVAMLAPTEILAEQHYHTIKRFVEKAMPGEIKITQLVSGQKAKVRREAFESISSGESNIIVGTHALFQNEMEYKNLGYVVIDEQHRFGVAQRAELIVYAKRSLDDATLSPHILVMTATPIPRTLTMTVYGELDVSIIKELPKNRKPIKTIVEFESARDKVYEGIRSELRKGRQAFIVYPLVEKSEKLELKAAVENFDAVRNDIFPEFKCGLLHGQMFWYEKDETMQAFLAKEYDLLVATTVIEVGIDIPNATIMLVENAERFGLSQLHQLRGRVGRGSEQSYCILMTKDHFRYSLKSSSEQNERLASIVRLKTMERTNDGFEIAEVDLKLRGPGDMLGTRQAGLPEFKYADLVADREILLQARSLAMDIIDNDPELSKSENSLLKSAMDEKYSMGSGFFGIA